MCALYATDGSEAFTGILPREAESARAARQMVDKAVADWGLSELAETARLVASELVGNAVVHGKGSSIRVTVARVATDRVKVAVVDLSLQVPQIARTDEALGESGRGLFLIDALTPRWGVDEFRWGKRVWVEVAPPPEEQPVCEIPMWHTIAAQAIYLAALLAVMSALAYGFATQ
ncbi:ATP-binding protein [Streptomyces sp. NPDC055239]